MHLSIFQKSFLIFKILKILLSKIIFSTFSFIFEPISKRIKFPWKKMKKMKTEKKIFPFWTEKKRKQKEGEKRTRKNVTNRVILILLKKSHLLVEYLNFLQVNYKLSDKH